MKFKAKDFDQTRNIKFPRGRFDMSHTHQGTYDFGKLYPVFCEMTMPSDRWELAQVAQVVMQPTVSPVKHQIDLMVHYFWVPFSAIPNIIDDEINSGMDAGTAPPEYPYHNAYWDQFISGGFEGLYEGNLKSRAPDAADLTPGSLYDHFGFPMVNIGIANDNKYWTAPFHAYQTIYNFFYRDETVEPAISCWDIFVQHQYELRTRNWEKDYYTSAQLNQQRGVAPGIPVEGEASVAFLSKIHVIADGTTTKIQAQGGGTQNVETATSIFGSQKDAVINTTDIDDNVLDLEGLAIAIDQLRLQVATQRFLERNQRNGYRPSEFIRSHFNDAPADERTDMPYYIGGTRMQVMTNEVIQVSETNETPQGSRTGIGAAHGGGKVGSFHAKDFGLIIGIASIMPRSMYTQGYRREFNPDNTRLDFPFPEFANLSEQAITTREVYAYNEASNKTIFGYQGRLDEFRQRRNMAVGLMRQTTDGLASWNLARNFGAPPLLGQEFLEVETQELKDRIFVFTEQPGFIVTFGNIATADRPIPYVAEPGLLDHV